MTKSVVTGQAPAFELAIAYPRENDPGTKFNYNTAESQVPLELVRRAAVWMPRLFGAKNLRLGMEHSGAGSSTIPAEGAEVGGAMLRCATGPGSVCSLTRRSGMARKSYR